MYPQLRIRETSSCKKRWPSVAHVVCWKKGPMEIDKLKSVHRPKGIRARAHATKKSRMSWCEFNSAYKRKLSWNSPTRRSKSRQRKLTLVARDLRATIDLSSERQSDASDYRRLKSADVTGLVARTGYRKAIWNLSQAVDFRCTTRGKTLHGYTFFFLFIYFLINWDEVYVAKKGKIWSNGGSIRWKPAYTAH